jgi:hypothetical protein
MRPALRLALAAGLLLPACARAPAAAEAAPTILATFEPADAPPALAPAVGRADVAVKQLKDRLARRLLEELADPPVAVAVCRDEAPAIAAEVIAESGVQVGRTSHRLRNQANVPRPWMRAFLAAAAGKPAAEVRPVAVDLGDRVGVLRPIAVGTPCLKCHGPAEGIDPLVREVLARAYPLDKAVGFAPGELRGFFWAEAAK